MDAHNDGHGRSTVRRSLTGRILRLVCMEGRGYLAVAVAVRLMRGGGLADINTDNDACAILDIQPPEHSVAFRNAAFAPGIDAIRCGGPGGRVGFGGAAEAILDALGGSVVVVIWTDRHAPHRVLLHVFLADRVSEATAN